MHPTKNDLSEATRTAVVELLNASLADAIDLALQAKFAHWNVKGPSFASLHALFDQVVDAAQGFTDELAERAVQLGGTAYGTLAHASQASRLPRYPADALSGREHVDALSTTLAAFAKASRAAIDRAAQLGDGVTADLFTEITAEADKYLWMLEAHLQGDR